LACVLEKKADYIVSRDSHLRNLKHYHGIQIVDATTFIEKVKKNWIILNRQLKQKGSQR